MYKINFISIMASTMRWSVLRTCDNITSWQKYLWSLQEKSCDQPDQKRITNKQKIQIGCAESEFVVILFGTILLCYIFWSEPSNEKWTNQIDHEKREYKRGERKINQFDSFNFDLRVLIEITVSCYSEKNNIRFEFRHYGNPWFHEAKKNN
jgi:hypothetical protein